MVDLDVKLIAQLYNHLGRQKVHDPRSRRFAVTSPIDKSTWRSKSIRVYDPAVNPTQCHGECTGTTKAMQFNSSSNRKNGVVLGMKDAHEIYTQASHNDPWPGGWPPVDTGSSGLASCTAAQMLGLGGDYLWDFRGADGVVQLIQENKTVSVGTWWYDGLMFPNDKNVVEPTGPKVGGHQFLARGYDVNRDMVQIRCWWGEYRDVWIRRSHLNDLILDDGDAHTQKRMR